MDTNQDQGAETPATAKEIPVAPPAHSPSGSPPTPPAWSYRAGGAPVGPSGSATPAGPMRHQRPQGAPALPGPARGGATSFGPAGRERSPLAVVLLSVLTLGVYTLLWHGRINDEMSDFDPRMRVRAASSMLAVGLAWLIGCLVTLAGAARIVVHVLNVSLPFDPHVTVTQAYYLLAGIVAVPYITLVIPFSIVAVVMTLERIRVVEDRIGLTTDVQLQPAHTVWWLIVPVIGGLAMIATMQRGLNRVWEQAGPRPAGLAA